jgi:arylformamidase
MKRNVLLLITAFIFLTSSCATKKFKNVDFIQKPISGISKMPKLNVFIPRKKSPQKMPILLFIHGGNWNTGNKNTYDWLGRNFANSAIITMIPDYTLSPNTDYDGMAREVAAAIKWAKAHAADYNGDPNRIFITGHSAGGHLAALAVMNPKYGISKGAIAGIILNDAAGLDMKHYLEDNPPTENQDYLKTWSNDSEKWRDASPIYFLDKDMPPFMIYLGTKTYNSIKVANERFVAALKPFQPEVTPIFINKSHIPMVLQYFWPSSNRFDETIIFMKNK